MKKDNLKQFYKEFPSNPDARVKALKSILEKEGLIDQKALDEILDTYQNKVGPLNGAKIVAKAWANKKFKEDLINNTCLLYTSPSPRDQCLSRMPSSA